MDQNIKCKGTYLLLRDQILCLFNLFNEMILFHFVYPINNVRSIGWDLTWFVAERLTNFSPFRVAGEGDKDVRSTMDPANGHAILVMLDIIALTSCKTSRQNSFLTYLFTIDTTFSNSVTHSLEIVRSKFVLFTDKVP